LRGCEIRKSGEFISREAVIDEIKRKNRNETLRNILGNYGL